MLINPQRLLTFISLRLNYFMHKKAALKAAEFNFLKV